MENNNGVVVRDISMPFGSMVVFMVKWAIASIPALIILWGLMMIFGGLLTSFFLELGRQ